MTRRTPAFLILRCLLLLLIGGCQYPVQPGSSGARKDNDTSGRQYVMSIYFVPADGADGSQSLLNEAAYASPQSLAQALAKSEKLFGAAHVSQGLVHLSHSVGHAYINFFSRDADGSNPITAQGFPTGQTGDGSLSDLIDVGAGGTILRVYPGWMNSVDDAAQDIQLRTQNHGRSVIVHGPSDVAIASENSAQLIGRMDVVLNRDNWNAIQQRLALHEREAATRYGLMMEPAVASRHPGENGGEGGGCTSIAAMCIGYTGAIERSQYAPRWTRTVTFGERTIGADTYSWGSHILAPWPMANVRKRPFGESAVLNLSRWTYPRLSSLTWDQPLYAVSLDSGTEEETPNRQISGYWYDPDYMYFWLRSVFESARQDASGVTESLGRRWSAKSTLSADTPGGYPYIETNAVEASPKADYDSCPDPLHDDWSDVDGECLYSSGGEGDYGDF